MAVGVVLVAVLIARLAWEKVARSRFDAVVRAARDAGQPTGFDDFTDPPLTDNENNAAFHYARAANSIRLSDEDDKFLGSLSPDLPLIEWERKKLNPIISGRWAIENEMLIAEACKTVNWGDRICPDKPWVIASVIQPRIRRLATYLRFCVRAEVDDCAFESALAHAITLVELGDAYQRAHAGLVTHLTGNGCSSAGALFGEQVAVNWFRRPGPTIGLPSFAKQMIGRLLDEAPSRDGGIRGVCGDRTVALVLSNGIIRPGPLFDGDEPWWLLKPVIFDDARILWIHDTAGATAFSQSDLPTAIAMLQPPVRGQSSAQLFARGGSNSLVLDYNRVLKAHFKSLVERRATAVLLACRMFEQDDGRFPGALAELSPKYLATVPADPMTSGGRPFHYRVADGVLTLYSVGTDGIDDGGSAIYKDGAVLADYRWRSRDAVYVLHAR